MVLHRYNLYMSKGDVVAYSRAGTDLLAFLFRDYYSRAEVKGQSGRVVVLIDAIMFEVNLTHHVL